MFAHFLNTVSHVRYGHLMAKLTSKSMPATLIGSIAFSYQTDRLVLQHLELDCVTATELGSVTKHLHVSFIFAVFSCFSAQFLDLIQSAMTRTDGLPIIKAELTAARVANSVQF
jgi:hypothetical protein